MSRQHPPQHTRTHTTNIPTPPSTKFSFLSFTAQLDGDVKAAIVTSSLCTFSTFQAQTVLISVHTHTHGHIMSIDRSCLLKGLQPSQAALTGNCLFNPNLSQLQVKRLIILCAAHNPEIIYEMFGDYNLHIKDGL